ncbi:hypothetical protein RRG08_065952 [Elysia crispata]|uniref:Uncharacterized protein n=1 Tax=Elysia crispata TaxID=231223 RepID=A0AAE1DGI5_9GAST|nr:hypothetical protein RRG08_065952 [Elysia crispata]
MTLLAGKLGDSQTHNDQMVDKVQYLQQKAAEGEDNQRSQGRDKEAVLLLSSIGLNSNWTTTPESRLRACQGWNKTGDQQQVPSVVYSVRPAAETWLDVPIVKRVKQNEGDVGSRGHSFKKTRSEYLLVLQTRSRPKIDKRQKKISDKSAFGRIGSKARELQDAPHLASEPLPQGVLNRKTNCVSLMFPDMAK